MSTASTSFSFPSDPRGQAKLWAVINGYFWLPCPSCGEEFGGHEHVGITLSGHIGSLHEHGFPNRGKAICPQCTHRGVGCISHAVAQHPVHPDCPFLFEE